MGKKGVVVLQIIIFALAGAAFVLGFEYINHVSEFTGEEVLSMSGLTALILATWIGGFILHIFVHESGHLIGGLLSGYGFISISFLNLTFFKANGKLTVKNYRAPGSYGSCMLAPPEMKNGIFPFRLYIGGGVLANFLLSALCFVLFYNLARTAGNWASVFLILGIAGTILGLLNFIPQNIILPNDGFMLFHLGKEENNEMRRSLWACFRIQTLSAKGLRPRDIPKELFDFARTNEIKDTYVFLLACKKYEYLMDQQQWSEAKELMQTLCHQTQNISNIIKMSCRAELLFHELIGECRQEKVESLLDNALKKHMKISRLDCSTCRILYAYERLYTKDASNVKEERALFERSCANTIQPGAATAEKELVAFVDTIAAQREQSEL